MPRSKRLFVQCITHTPLNTKSLFLCLIFLCLQFQGINQDKYFDYDPELSAIYEDIIQLKLDKASADLQSYQVHKPNNLTTYHLKSYIDFFTLFINENKDIYNQLAPHKKKYLNQIEGGPNTSPYQRFCRAEILLQWALIDLKFDQKFQAGKAIYSAYKLLEENKALFPDFIDNNKSLSIIHVLAESVPKWVRSLLGIEGSISLGHQEISFIKDYALKHKDYLFREEVAAINSYILFYQTNHKEQAINDLDAFDLDHKKSPLLAFLKASMALRSGNNEACLHYLNEAPESSEYADFYYLKFMKGRSLLYQMNPESDHYMLEYVTQFRGKHFIKEAYQKLAWHALVLDDNPKRYDYYIKQCKNLGEQLLDEDKQAYKEAISGITPNNILLQARILFDGGYYHQSFSLLNLKKDQIPQNSKDQLELNYRQARALQSLHKNDKALIYFSKVLDLGKQDKYYYGCSSALQMGTIYENWSMPSEAKIYYELALSMDPENYKNSLHQKAKSGLDRITNAPKD